MLGDTKKCQLQGMRTGAVEGGRAGRGPNMAPKGQLKRRVLAKGAGGFPLHHDLVLALLGQGTTMVT